MIIIDIINELQYWHAYQYKHWYRNGYINYNWWLQIEFIKEKKGWILNKKYLIELDAQTQQHQQVHQITIYKQQK